MSFNFVRMPVAGHPAEDELSKELVVKLYRCAMAGLCLGDTRSWDYGQRLLAKAVPLDGVGSLFGQFYAFGRALLAAAERPLACRPVSYSGICAEEALALRMIEMSQRANHTETLSAASALVGVDDLGNVLQATQGLARALAVRGLFVRSPLEPY
jgi:hypothetical protein